MNPTHKQKKSKEPDAPQWYIDAHLDSLKNGIGVIAIGKDQECLYISPEQYLEFAEILMAEYQEIKGISNP
jgi:hypothetical protein